MVHMTHTKTWQKISRSLKISLLSVSSLAGVQASIEVPSSSIQLYQLALQLLSQIMKGESYEMRNSAHGVVIHGAPEGAQGRVLSSFQIKDAPGMEIAGNGDGLLSPGESFRKTAQRAFKKKPAFSLVNQQRFIIQLFSKSEKYLKDRSKVFSASDGKQHAGSSLNFK